MKLRVPSLQHLARNWHDDPLQIARVLVRLAENPPRMNYDPVFSAVRDYLVLGVPYVQIVKGITTKVRRAGVRDNFLGILPLIRDYFEGISPTFVQSVQRRYYAAGRGLLIPFEPPLIYGLGGKIRFPWFSFWRRNPIVNEGLSLFVTIVEEVLLQDPDLEDAEFEILDFSAAQAGGPRELRIIDARCIPRVNESRKTQMLSTFADGFDLARAVLAGRPRTEPDKGAHDDRQPDFFND